LFYISTIVGGLSETVAEMHFRKCITVVINIVWLCYTSQDFEMLAMVFDKRPDNKYGNKPLLSFYHIMFRNCFISI